MLPETKPSSGRRPGRLPSSELHSGKDPNLFPLVLGEPVVASDRVRGDHQRVVEFGAVRILATFHPEGVSEATAEVQLRGQIAVDVPSVAGRGQARDAGVTLHVAGRAQAGIKGS
jgi:hypothetical protein